MIQINANEDCNQLPFFIVKVNFSVHLLKTKPCHPKWQGFKPYSSWLILQRRAGSLQFSLHPRI